MSNVVGLRGEATPTFEPDPETVAEAEKILDLARSGEIIGIQVIALHRDGAAVSLLRAGNVNYAMVGMLTCATHEAIEILQQQEG